MYILFLIEGPFISVSSISITMDIWSNRVMMSYIGVSSCYISEWKLHSLVLCCKRLRDRHTADRILQKYESIVSEIKIDDRITYLQIMLQI